MRVALDQAGVGDAGEAGPAAQVVQAGRADVAHAAAQAAGQLEHVVGQRALVGHLALDPFGHQLAEGTQVLPVALGGGVAVAGPALHRAYGAHAAVLLEAPAFVNHQVAGRFLQAGQQRAQHHRAGAGRQRLDDVAGVLDAAVGDHRHAVAPRGLGAVGDSRHLRHACAGHDAGRADGTGPDAHLDHIRAGLDQRLDAFSRHHVAGQHRQVGCDHFDALDGAQHAGRVAVGRVHCGRVHAGIQQQLQPLVQLRAHAHRRSHQQAAPLVGGRVGEVQLLENVLVGDQPLEVVVVVHQRQLFDAMAVQDGLGLLQRGAHGRGDQVLAGHVGRDGRSPVGGEAHIAVGEDAHQLAVVGHRQARDVVAHHDGLGVGQGVVRAQSDGVDDHAGLGALDLVYFVGLRRRAEVAVDDADAALAGQRNGQPRLGHRVHGRREHRDVQMELIVQLGADIDLGWQHLGKAGHQQHVVEGQGLKA